MASRATEVTVIVPSFNGNTRIAPTIRSAASQSLRPIQIIVVDDGSEVPYDERDLAQHAGEIPFTLVRNHTNRGVAGARNAGVRAARSPWLAFCDDDDRWSRDKLASQTASMSSGEVWSVVSQIEVDQADRIVGVSRADQPRHEPLSKALREWNRIPGGGSGLLAKATALQSIGGFDERFRHLDDWDMYLSLAQLGDPGRSANEFVIKRVRPNQMTTKSEELVRDLKLFDKKWSIDRSADSVAHRWIAHGAARNGIGHIPAILQLEASAAVKLRVVASALFRQFSKAETWRQQRKLDPRTLEWAKSRLARELSRSETTTSDR